MSIDKVLVGFISIAYSRKCKIGSVQKAKATPRGDLSQLNNMKHITKTRKNRSAQLYLSDTAVTIIKNVTKTTISRNSNI